MPIKIAWLLPQRVLYVRVLGGQFTGESLRHMLSDVEQQAHTAAQPVHVIFNGRDTADCYDDLPGTLARVQQYFASPAIGLNFIITDQWLKRYMIALLLLPSYRARLKVFETVPLALTFLQRVDATLPPLPLPDSEA
jgi:hypothetical protein